jgi:hypothetical protein
MGEPLLTVPRSGARRMPKALRLALQLTALLGVIVVASQADQWVLGMLDLGASHPDASLPFSPAVIAALVTYTLLMALPFCPGIEIGIALLVLFGAEAAVIVYVASKRTPDTVLTTAR